MQKWDDWQITKIKNLQIFVFMFWVEIKCISLLITHYKNIFIVLLKLGSKMLIVDI